MERRGFNGRVNSGIYFDVRQRVQISFVGRKNLKALRVVVKIYRRMTVTELNGWHGYRVRAGSESDRIGNANLDCRISKYYSSNESLVNASVFADPVASAPGSDALVSF